MLLIKNGNVWDGNSFSKKDILFDDKHIVKIEDTIDIDEPRTFDANGFMVLPGLIDIHTHLKNISIDLFGIDASSACFPNGVTCAVDAAAVSSDKATLDKTAVKCAVFVHPNLRNGRYYFDNFEKYSTQYGDRLLGFKLFYDGDDLDDTKPLEEVCDFAHSHGLNVMVHTTGSPVSMMDFAKALGKGDIITHSFHGGKNNSAEDDFECLKFARQKGIIIDTGFAGNVHTDFAVLKKALDMGFYPDTVSTDITRSSAFIRSGRYGLNYCMSILRTLGMPENEIFKGVTENAAAAVHREGIWGTLKVGSSDLTVLGLMDEPYSMTDRSGNTVSDSKSYRAILTVSDGDVVYRI